MDTIRKTGQVLSEVAETFSRAGFGPSLGLDNEDHQDHFETTSAKNVSIEEPLFKGEFPNYFHTNDPVQAARIKAKVNLAMGSVIRRLQLPYVHPKTGEISRDGFFKAIDDHIKQQDPGAKIYIAGGVVRSILGYIYKKIYNEHQRGSTPDTTEAVLDRIILGASRKPLAGPFLEDGSMQEGRLAGDRTLVDKELEQLTALGIGSDLDILIEYSASLSETAKKNIEHSATQLINSAETKFNLRNFEVATLKKSLVPVGDVKEYGKQMDRTTKQGGCSLDWLAFSIDPNSPEPIRMPKAYPKIMDNFFNGEVEYLKGSSSEDLDKQTVRGLRPLLEIPFLRLTPEGQKQILTELEQLLSRLKSGAQLSSGAIEQFEKLMRNARFEAAHNRFSEANNSDPIAHLVHQISILPVRSDKNMPLVPEFLLSRSIEARVVNEEARVIDDSLMKVEEFKNSWTNNGVLYHGTPRFEYVLSMIRNGLMPSIPKSQGKAFCGGGFYTATEKATSSGYTSSEGTVLELPVNLTAGLRVLDLQKYQNKHPIDFMKHTLEAKRQGKDINLYLAEKFNLDIIVNEYPLVMNPKAVQFPKKAKDLVKAFFSEGVAAVLLKHSYKEIVSFIDLGAAMGVSGLPDLKQIGACLKDSGYNVRETAIQVLVRTQNLAPGVQEQIAGYLKDSDPKVRQAAIQVLWGIQNLAPGVLEPIAACLKDSDPDVRQTAINALGKTQNLAPGLQEQIADCLKDSDPKVREAAIKALEKTQNLAPGVQEQIAGYLKDSDPSIRQIAIQVLGQMKNLVPGLQKQIADYLKDSNPKVRQAAINALGKTQNLAPGLQEQIAACLKDSDSNVRETAIFALGETQNLAPGLQEQIADCLKDSGYNVSQAAIQVLVRTQNLAPGVQEQIAGYLKDSDPKVRQAAIQVLFGIQNLAPGVLEPIAACLKDSDSNVRDYAILALGKTQNPAPGLLKQIAACLKDSNRDVRRTAMHVLGNCKVQDQEILDKIAMCFLERNDFWDIDKVWEELTGVDTTKDRTDFRRLAIGVSAALREGTRAIGSLWKR